MSDPALDLSPRLQARVAGALYLVIIVAGAIGYTLHSSPIVWNDAAATADNILASEQSWRLSAAVMLVMLASDVGVAAIFYVLFRPVDRVLSLIACMFRLVLVAVVGVSILFRYLALYLAKDSYSAAIGAEQSEALVILSVRLFEQGFTIALVFFGIHCLVLGWLIFRASFLPRFLGVLLLIAGALYVIDSVRVLVLPQFTVPFDLLIPSYVAELVLCLWLLVIGLNADKWHEQAGATELRHA